jgi:multidrug efflux pump subunit AcrA (membrane-fusion protein)
MWKKLTALFNNHPTVNLNTDNDCLALKQQVQSLELELLEREQTIAGLKSSLEKLRTGENSLASEKAKAQIENMMADASAPASQLLDQEVGFKPGDPVQIRFSSIAYQGKLLRKAGVSAAPKISASEVA